MPIKVGDRLPDAKFRVMTKDGPAWKTTDEIFKGRKVALFAVPGAFTRTCHASHLPSILSNIDAIKAKGVDTVAITAVNDVFVMDAWQKATNADAMSFLPDGNGDFARAIDLMQDSSGGGMGMRSQRYAMLVDDGVVKAVNIEDGPGKIDKTSGEALLKQL